MMLELTALIIGFGLLARWMLDLHRENQRLRSARPRTAALLRKLRRQRQDCEFVLEEACGELTELRLECAAYRSEEMRRGRGVRSGKELN